MTHIHKRYAMIAALSAFFGTTGEGISEAVLRSVSKGRKSSTKHPHSSTRQRERNTRQMKAGLLDFSASLKR